MFPTGRASKTLLSLAEHRTDTAEHAARIDAKFWRSDCPACRGRPELTWAADAKGPAADFVCGKGATIIAAARARRQALRAKDRAASVNRLPKALQMDGEDMVEMREPPYQFDDNPETPPRGNPFSDSWP